MPQITVTARNRTYELCRRHTTSDSCRSCARFSVPRDNVVGKWTLQATLNGGASTQIISAAVTGFTSDQHGWRFLNIFGKIGSVVAGFGPGMSCEAVHFYESGVTIPDVTPLATKKSNLYKQLQNTQKKSSTSWTCVA
jgi:hypothetical protein